MRETSRRQAVLAVISACVVLVFGLGAGVNLAVGRLATSVLHPTPAQVLWIVDIYLVVFGCLLIPAGALGDRMGHKQMLLAGLAVLAAGSVASAVAPSVPLLLAGRMLAGAGAALILPNSLSLLVDCFPPDERPHAVAVWTGMTGLGGAVGNLGGGLILQFYDWQMLFAAAAPLAVVALVIVGCVAPRTEGRKAPLDLPGVVILVLAIFSLLFGIIESQERGWCSDTVLGAFAASVLITAVFVRHGLRRTHPLIDPRVFSLPGLRAGVLGIVTSFVGMYSLFYLNGQYLMSDKGYPPFLAGVCVLPMAVAMYLLSPRSVALARRLGERRTVAVGLLMLACGLALMAVCDAGTPYLIYVVVLVLIGAGSALSNPLLSLSIIGSLPQDKAGVGSGINSFTREIGGALGVALFGSLLNTAYAQNLPEALRGLASTGNAEMLKAIGSTLELVERVGGTQADWLTTLARSAFSDAMGQAVLVVAGLVALGAVPVAAWMKTSSVPKAQAEELEAAVEAGNAPKR